MFATGAPCTCYNQHMPTPTSLQNFWTAYLASLPGDHPHHSRALPQHWAFGDSPELADELLALVLSGLKTGTCTTLETFAREGEPVPQPGDLSIVLDGADRPACLIETIRLEVHMMDEVGDEFAASEGEGDRTYAYWREAHMTFFTRDFARRGQVFDPTAEPLACETFRLLFWLPPENRP